MARACGMKVEEFGFGFPPRVFGIRRGSTLYSINWIPIGWIRQNKRENGDDRHATDSFSSKKIWQRFLVLVAGVAMNFFLAAILLSIGFMIGLPSIIDRILPATAHVSERHLSVMRVLPDSPAEKAGITEGDVIVTIDGRVMEKEDDVRTYLADHGTKGIDLAIEKVDKTIRAVHVTAEPLVGAQITGIGDAFVQTGRVSYPVYLAVTEGVRATIQMNGQILSSFFGLLKSFVQGHGAGGESFWSRWNCCHDRSSCFDGFCVYFTICCTSFDQPRCRQYFTVSGARWRPNLFLLIEKIRENIERTIRNLRT